MKFKSICISVFLILCFAQAQGQEKPKNWTLNGYVKSLQTTLVNRIRISQLGVDTTLVLTDNLIHNRLNFKWFINDNWTFKSDLRTRMFFGELVKSDPNYGLNVDDANNDFLDMSVNIVNADAFVFNTTLDRLYLDYVKGNWEVRLGRQRINWGINTVWNPNDIFNAFAFTDFDYEERPGSDALRVQYYTGPSSSLELAVKAFDQAEEAVVGLLWKFNKSNYDFQVLAGYVQEDLALGGGWAGNIKKAGFKGEFTYFQALQDSVDNAFAATFAVDYTFEKGTYISGGMLFNSSAQSNQTIDQLFSFNLTAKNLYPYRWTILTQVSHPISPLLTSSLAVIYSPSSTHALFINPTFTYSIAQDWDIDLVGQIIFNRDGNFYSPIQAIFLRTKFSF